MVQSILNHGGTLQGFTIVGMQLRTDVNANDGFRRDAMAALSLSIRWFRQSSLHNLQLWSEG